MSCEGAGGRGRLRCCECSAVDFAGGRSVVMVGRGFFLWLFFCVQYISMHRNNNNAPNSVGRPNTSPRERGNFASMYLRRGEYGNRRLHEAEYAYLWPTTRGQYRGFFFPFPRTADPLFHPVFVSTEQPSGSRGSRAAFRSRLKQLTLPVPKDQNKAVPKKRKRKELRKKQRQTSNKS